MALTKSGPVDVERQCGVLKDGVACARSLTCKSHSMGAKRAVPGRSLPYDMLLAAYQKKNQAKQQSKSFQSTTMNSLTFSIEAAIDANAPLEDEEEGNGPLDSDEELTNVMQGLSAWDPQPVVEAPVQVPIAKQYQLARLREQMMNATNNMAINIFAVKGYGRQKLPEDHPGYVNPGHTDQPAILPDGDLSGDAETVVSRRASSFVMNLPTQRRPSQTAVARA